MMPLVKLGPFALSSFGITLLLALWLGSWQVDRLLARQGAARLPSAALLGLLIAGFVGGRLWYALFNLDMYSRQPRLLWQVSMSGLAFPGVLVGGALVLYAVTVSGNRQVARWSDAIAAVLPWCQALGMLGLLLSGEAYGRPSSAPWAVPLLGLQRHPTQIYEAVALLALGVWLWRLLPRARQPGVLTAAYLIGYGGLRLLLEPLRGDTLLLPGGIRSAQVFGLALALGGLYWLWWRAPLQPEEPPAEGRALVRP